MKNKVATFLAPVALLALGACATPFKADVSRFQELPAPQGQSFVVKAADPADAGGIEFSQYAALIAGEMTELGYVAAQNGTADMTVLLDYSVDDGKERSILRQDPFYDPYWGFGRSYRPYIVRTRRGHRYISGYYDPFLYSGFNRPYDVDSFTVYTSGLDLKIDRNTDGKRLFEGKAEAKSPHEALIFYGGSELQAVRSGEWKLHFPHPYITVDGEPGRDGKPARFGQMKPKAITQSGIEGIASRHGYRVEQIGLSLFNLKDDPGETRDLAQEHPEIVARLQKLAEPMRKELGDDLMKVKGSANRPLGLAP